MLRTAFLSQPPSPPPSWPRDRPSPENRGLRADRHQRRATTNGTTTARRSVRCARTPSAAPTRWTSTPGSNGGIRVRGWDRGDVLVRGENPGIRRHRRRRAPARVRRAHRHVGRPYSCRRPGHRTVKRTGTSASRSSVPRNGDADAEHATTAASRSTTSAASAKFHAKQRRPVADQRRRRPARRDHQRRRHRRCHRRSLGRIGPRRRDHERRHPAERCRRAIPAELEAGTTHGGLNIDFPITVQGRIGRHLETTLGSGGPKLRAITTNGGVTIRQR